MGNHKDKDKKSFWTTTPVVITAIAALITAIGVVILALSQAGILVVPTPPATQTPPTETIPHVLTLTNTLSPAPAITPSPSPTSTVPLPGGDFEENCIHSLNWLPYKGEDHVRDDSGCWDLLPWGLFANRGLQLGVQLAGAGAFIEDERTKSLRGIYTQLEPQSSLIQFNIRIDEFSSVKDHNGIWLDQILMLGVIRESATNPAAQGKFLFILIGGPPGTQLVMAVQEDSSEAYMIKRFLPAPSGETYRVTLRIEGIRLTISIDGDQIVEPIDLPFSDRAFWIGYSMWSGSELQAFLSDLQITGQ